MCHVHADFCKSRPAPCSFPSRSPPVNPCHASSRQSFCESNGILNILNFDHLWLSFVHNKHAARLRSVTKSLQTSASNSESRPWPWLRNFMSFWSWKTRFGVFGSPSLSKVYGVFWNSKAVATMSPLLRQTLYQSDQLNPINTYNLLIISYI